MSADLNPELDELASAYSALVLRSHRRVSVSKAHSLEEDRGPDESRRDMEIESAVSKVLELGGEKAWQLIRKVVDMLPADEAVLAFFAAGELEYHWCSEAHVIEIRKALEDWLVSDPKAFMVFRNCWSESASLKQLLAKFTARSTS